MADLGLKTLGLTDAYVELDTVGSEVGIFPCILQVLPCILQLSDVLPLDVPLREIEQSELFSLWTCSTWSFTHFSEF